MRQSRRKCRGGSRTASYALADLSFGAGQPRNFPLGLKEKALPMARIVPGLAVEWQPFASAPATKAPFLQMLHSLLGVLKHPMAPPFGYNIL